MVILHHLCRAMQNLKMMENNQQNDGRNSKRDQLMQMQVDITRERQRKEQHRAQQIQQERQHMSQYSANLDQQDQQRLAHQNMIAARGNAMHGVNAGNFEVLASVLTALCSIVQHAHESQQSCCALLPVWHA